MLHSVEFCAGMFFKHIYCVVCEWFQCWSATIRNYKFFIAVLFITININSYNIFFNCILYIKSVLYEQYKDYIQKHSRIIFINFENLLLWLNLGYTLSFDLYRCFCPEHTWNMEVLWRWWKATLLFWPKGYARVMRTAPSLSRITMSGRHTWLAP